MPPLVSIITPSFNQANFLEETIHSVLSQDYPHLEYIIVDGGSTDGSLEIIQRYADRLAWWVSEPDRGQTDAINKGFDNARGEVFAWLNSDDTYLPGAIAQAVACLQAHPEAALVYGDANLVDEQGGILGAFPARQTNLRRMLRGSVHIPQQASFFRGNLWQKVGPLDPNFYFAMDYDLWLRLARYGIFIYTPQRWANFRLHGGGKTALNDDRCYPEMIHAARQVTGRSPKALILRWYIRRLFYARLPQRLRLWLRRSM